MTSDETRRPSRKSERPTAPDPAPSGAVKGPQRVAKAMARAGLCSRRDAEAWILEGRVSVNGHVLTSPALDVGPQDVVLVDGAPLPAAEKTRLFLFHKPRGLVTSDYDPEGRATVADFLREHWPEGPRVVTVGRLDINTEGLLLLTNDGGLARALELPATGWLRRYRVRAKGTTDQAALDSLADGITIEGIDYLGIEAKLDRAQGSNTWLTMGLREGKNREIKRVLEHLGLEVNRLIRLSFGPFQLLDLPEGAVEEVRTRVLRDQLGDALIREAGLDFGEREPAPATRRDTPSEPPPRRETRGFGTARGTPPSQTREPADRRETTAPGGRRHVSTLRAQTRDAAQTGPRRRIERAETVDPKKRKVAVERVMTARPAATREEPRRDGERPRGKGPRREHASPSALGKRERIARSGGGRPDARRDDRRAPAQEERRPRPRREAEPSREGSRRDGERPMRRRDDGRRPDARSEGRSFSAGDRPRRDERGSAPRGDRPRDDRAPRGSRPNAAGRKPHTRDERPREGSAERGERRPQRDREVADRGRTARGPQDRKSVV